MLDHKYTALIKPIEHELNRRIEDWGTAAAKTNRAEYEQNLHRYFSLEQALRVIMCKPLTREDISQNEMRVELTRFCGQIQKGLLLHTDPREAARQKEVVKLLQEYIKIELTEAPAINQITNV